MKVAGQAVLHAPVDKVWDALLDPQVLVGTIPGCERLEATGENTYAMTVSAGVASIRGTYAGTCALSDLQPHESLTMRAEGAGGPGTISADVAVRFADAGDGTTGVEYEADAIVGGMLGGVGQRMLTSVSKRMAGEFFGAVDTHLTAPESPATAPESPATGGESPATGGESPRTGQVFSAPAKQSRGPEGDFLTGVLVGAGLVLAGVVVGGIFGGRRHR